MKPNPIVLLIDDDKANRRLLRMLLESQHYRFFETYSDQRGLAAIGERHPDVIILELSLPDTAGLTLLKRLRRSGETPVLVLSSCTREADKVAALDCGANDYMNKPFSEIELLARLRVLRRCFPSEFEDPVLVEGELKVDIANHQVTLSGHKLDFTPTEEALIHTLVRYAGNVMSGKYLLRSVWGAEGESQGHCLRVFISMLRKKLEETQGRIVIQTAGSFGYRLLLRSGGQFTPVLSFA